MCTLSLWVVSLLKQKCFSYSFPYLCLALLACVPAPRHSINGCRDELKFNNPNSSRYQEGPWEWSEMIERDAFVRDSQGTRVHISMTCHVIISSLKNQSTFLRRD